MAGPVATLHAASFPAPHGTGGAVVADEAAATEIGLEILRRGGNAADAAVATALALVVVHPEAGNLGGGGFAVVKLGDQLASLDFRETAPTDARHDMYMDPDGKPNGQASTLGPLAAGVPGSPVGLWELHRRFGRLDWAEVVIPAQRLAADGFTVSSRLHRAVAESQSELSRFPESAAVWLPKGEPPAAGSRMLLPALAATLGSYADAGPEALTSGTAAAAIEQISTQYDGILQAADLEAYEAVWRPAVRFEALGWSFATMGLPSSGGIIIGQTLAQLKPLRWHEWPRFGAERAHRLAEVWRRSFADRFLLGDPSTTAADVQQLLGGDWLAWRRSTIDPGRATPSSEVVQTPAAPTSESEDTTHVSVIDSEGNLVALTTTLNGSFGCKVMVPELGYFLNNEMDDFAVAPGHPNMFGLIQGEANAIAPGKRMLSSMNPTVAWSATESLAIGGRGGSKIPTATVQVLLNLLVDGDPLQVAVNRPRLHHQWLPDRLDAERDALSPETREALERRGHRIELLEKIASVNVVQGFADGTVAAAADPRVPGVAGVVQPLP